MECVWRGEANAQRGWAEGAGARLAGTFPASNPIIGGENWVWCEGSTAGVRGGAPPKGIGVQGAVRAARMRVVALGALRHVTFRLFYSLALFNGADACCSIGGGLRSGNAAR